MLHILNLTIQELEKNLIDWQEAPFHAQQIFNWIYKKGVMDFIQMSDLSRDLRERLRKNFYIVSLKPKSLLESRDGTRKLILELEDKNLIEAVIIPAEGRLTGCISTQAGCKFKCIFCASGIKGFKRDLACGEIIEEVLCLKEHAPDKKLSHLVFMGTGEPLDNYENSLKAARIINSKECLNIGARRITISTCGLIPEIKRLARENLQFELSISLHAGDEKTRSRLMPINKKYPLRDLLAVCKEYIEKTGRQITFEYILIKAINSDLQNAKNLSKILKGLRLAKVNLIPANPVKELGIEPPNKLEVLFFRDYLKKEGLNVTLRMPRGEDIQAACGQLRLCYEDK
jgi:23S rRNA (adenine2503-C2)-methyltransferase